MAVIDGVKECVAGAKVELRNGASTFGARESDAFGDFKFDSIEPNSGAYTLTISHPKHGGAKIDVKVAADSICAGDIMLA